MGPTLVNPCTRPHAPSARETGGTGPRAWRPQWTAYVSTSDGPLDSICGFGSIWIQLPVDASKSWSMFMARVFAISSIQDFIHSRISRPKFATVWLDGPCVLVRIQVGVHRRGVHCGPHARGPVPPARSIPTARRGRKHLEFSKIFMPRASCAFGARGRGHGSTSVRPTVDPSPMDPHLNPIKYTWADLINRGLREIRL